MTISQLILELQKIENQDMLVYKINNEDHFVPLSDEDLADIEFGEGVDKDGNLLEEDDDSNYTGMHVLCVNWESFTND